MALMAGAVSLVFQLGLVLVVLVGVLVVSIRVAQRSSAGVAGPAGFFLALVLLGAFAASLSAYSRASQRLESRLSLEAEIPERVVRSPDPTAPEYVSSDRCFACHPGNAASWHESYHRSMTQTASPDAVLADFEVRTLSARGRRYQLERRGDEYWVEMADPDWERDLLDSGRRPERFSRPPMRWKRIVMTTGSHHMQTYWVASERDGRLFNFPWLWLIEEKRWIPREEGFIRPPDGPRTFDVWHGACVECHAVAGEKNREPDGAWSPSAAELGIACESCHGPAEEHVKRNQDPLRRYRLRLASRPDPTIVNPARLDARAASQVCGQCHGINLFKGHVRRDGKRYRPGGELGETRIIMRATEKARREAEDALAATERGGRVPTIVRDYNDMQDLFARELARDESFLRDRFWPDGMVRVSGREHNSFIESACYDGGEISCLTCHSMHDSDPDDQLATRATGRGDAVCLDCHSQFEDDAPRAAHTRHSAASAGSQCTNCHMPHTVYGLLKAIRSHWIDSPSAQATLATGRPNACELCHLDRSLGWTADRLSEWYGQPRPDLTNDQEKIASGARWALTGNAHQRALAAWHLGWPDAHEALGPEAARSARYLLGHLLDDPYPAVRYIAARSLTGGRPESNGVHAGLADLDYDFLAPPAVRAEVRARVMASAAARGAAPPIDRPTFDRLAAQRDDQEMDLRE